MTVDKAHVEKKKFKRFYLFATILWLMSLGLFIISAQWISSANIDEGTKVFANNIRGIILTFILWGIPIIFILSFVIRLVEPVMDRVKDRMDAKKDQ